MVKMAKNRKKRVVLYLNSTKGVAFSWSFFSKVARSSFRGGEGTTVVGEKPPTSPSLASGRHATLIRVKP